MQHPGQIIRLTDVAVIFREAYSATAKTKMAENAFKATGIEPFDPNVIDESLYAPSSITDHDPEHPT